MGKIPARLRENIARNIRECRLKKFPGRGGGKKCAEAFGVSPQQWSPWERGMRTPDETRLEAIAAFFNVSVEFLRRDHSTSQDMTPAFSTDIPSFPSAGRQAEETTINPPASPACPFFRPPHPGQPSAGEKQSACWLAERFLSDLRTHGLPVRLSLEDIEKLREMFRR